MLNHYLLIAWRSFKKNKAYSILNILGLTIGITCSLIIFLYVFDEITYDRHHQNWKNIVRLNAAYHLPNNGGMETYAVSGPVIGEVLAKDFPEIKQAVRMRKVNDVVVEKPASDERFYEMFIAADSNIFE